MLNILQFEYWYYLVQSLRKVSWAVDLAAADGVAAQGRLKK